MRPSGLAAALEAWRAALGSEHVITEPNALERAESATFAAAQRIPAILRPGSVPEVQDCLRIANRHRTPVYPVSRGRNWGLGSRVPASDGCALMELSRMARILDFDESLAYLTVEPGVTFGQAHAFLRSQGSRLYVPAMGGPSDASLIGNAVERGDGQGPNGDRAASIFGLQVVLPDGDLLETGLERFPEAKAAKLHRWGVGPHLDGLFLQANLGIVTRMTHGLARLPEHFLGFSCSVSTEALPGLLDAAHELSMREVLRGSSFTVWNSYKALAMTASSSRRQAGGGSAPPRGASLSPPWLATGTVGSASAEMGLAARTIVGDQLRASAQGLEFFDADHPPPGLEQPFQPGIPSDRNVRTLYWRKPTPPGGDMDPDRDRCGAIWLCPTVPFDGTVAAEALGLCEETILRHGFEPQVGACQASSRSLNAFVSIVFDRDVAGEDERAMACHDALFGQLLDLGHLPYRLGIHSMSGLPAGRGAYVALVRLLKKTLDPNDILAPGRYDFRNG